MYLFTFFFIPENATCSDMKVAQFYLLAILTLGAVSSVLAFIASYVSCCSMCDLEDVSFQKIFQKFTIQNHSR